MKKRIISTVVAVVMLLSLTTVAFADSNKNKANDKAKAKVEMKNVKLSSHQKSHLQKDLKDVQLKIKIVTKQLVHWTAKQAEAQKNLPAVTGTLATEDNVKIMIDTKLLATLKSMHDADIKVVGLSVEQIATFNKVYLAEEKALAEVITKETKEATKNVSDLQNALTQANKKVLGYTKDLAALKLKLAGIQAKLGIVVPTVTPTVAPTAVPTAVPVTPGV